MKAIVVFFDTLTRDFISSYGNDWIKTPNFDRLQKKSVTFDTCYVGSLPCMPARRELHTGRYNMLHRSWGPLEPFDNSMPEILKRNGVHTHLVSDHMHYWEDGGATYHQRYSTWEIVRGQEGDKWKGRVGEVEIPEPLKILYRSDAARLEYNNRRYMQTEEDQPQTKVMDLGLEFIEENKGADGWLVHIETFDPHEPYYSMEHYKKLYPHEYDGPEYDWPAYKVVTEDPQTINHLRMEYAALVSMCDRNLGRVLDCMDKNGLWEDTMLIVCTDHGFLLGEHGWTGKASPCYEEISHTPLFVWDPRLKVKGERRGSLVQTVDLAPTLLDFFNIPLPKEMLGKPLRGVVERDAPVREAALFGTHGAALGVTDGRYVYLRAPAGGKNEPLYEYTLMPTHMWNMFSVGELQETAMAPPFAFTKGCPVMKIKGGGLAPRETMKASALKSLGSENAALIETALGVYETALYDVKSDPKQQKPISDEAVEGRMKALMVKLMIENEAPAEQFERLGLKI